MFFKGRGASPLYIDEKRTLTVALAGNPNVGKSTIYNTLTGSRVHTGNWAGKTVGCESALVESGGMLIRLVDIPGAYSLFSHSEEERIARDYVCFGGADAVVIVCDCASLMQNLNLVLQIRETGRRAMVVLNFADEAVKKGICVDKDALSELLGIPVVMTVAHKKKTLQGLLDLILSEDRQSDSNGWRIEYSAPVERAVATVLEAMPRSEREGLSLRFAALRLLDGDRELREEIMNSLNLSDPERRSLLIAVSLAEEELYSVGIDKEKLEEEIVSAIVERAENIYRDVVTEKEKKSVDMTARADRILTGRVSAYPVMLLLLALVFFITLSLANYPSELLGRAFLLLENALAALFDRIGMPQIITELFLHGVLRTLGQVVSVMLPPMAIFFPLFALLEDSGYLPRIAYNLDRPFACSGACGKQALTMCMGFGCNAVGIVGARIIDSKRERLLAILTNSLVPCNGRLPMLVTLISIFYLFFTPDPSSLTVSLTLSLFIVVSIVVSFLATLLLSKTLLRGERSAFTIELPRYRRPRFLSVIWTSVRDKCISVLGRAICVAAPMGVLIWVLANVYIGESSLVFLISDTLSPVGRVFGLDGAILLAFILGIPANEIVIPLLIMIYSSVGVLPADISLASVRELFLLNGWTVGTAMCCATFALFHWPCSTSLITVYKETKSIKNTILAFIIPSVTGLALCFIINILL